jgi:hypothetical protein
MWGVFAALGGLICWFERRRRARRLDPRTLGGVSAEWFHDHRREL